MQLKMRRFIYIACIGLLGISILSSCTENNGSLNDTEVLVDTAPTPVCFIIKDSNNNNLLDYNVDSNILNQDISISGNCSEYVFPLQLCEYEPATDDGGLYIGSITVDNIQIPCLKYWYIHARPESENKQTHLLLNLGDGTSYEVDVDYYYQIDSNYNAIFHKRTWLNGELNSANSLVVTIIRE